MTKYSGGGKLVGLRFKLPVFKGADGMILYLDVMMGDKDVFRNLEFNMKESFGEVPILGNFYWFLIDDKKCKIVEEM